MIYCKVVISAIYQVANCLAGVPLVVPPWLTAKTRNRSATARKAPSYGRAVTSPRVRLARLVLLIPSHLTACSLTSPAGKRPSLATVQLNEQWQSVTELLYSYNDSAMFFGAPLTLSSGLRAYQQQSGNLVDISTSLPVGHPDNPTGKALPFEYTLFDVGPRLKSNNQIFNRLLTTLKYQGDDWDLSLNALKSSSQQREYVDNFVNRFEYEKALANGSYRFDGRQNSGRCACKTAVANPPARPV